MLHIGIIVGSTRPGRNGLQVGQWVHREAGRRQDAEYELVDVADFHLPLLDEPIPPSKGQYTKESPMPARPSSSSTTWHDMRGPRI